MVIQIRRTIALLALVTGLVAVGAVVGPAAAGATIRITPRVGRAMGLMPAADAQFDVASGQNYPVLYHGGPVMDSGPVTVHTIFWAPSGYAFAAAPATGGLGYEAMVEQFFTDVAHDSGLHSNVFSMLDQYGQNGQAGEYSIAYDPASDAILDTDPYPAKSDQCASPAGAPTCLTDAQVTAEVDHVIQTHDPAGYGLHDVWEVFLPDGVDECYQSGTCGTSAFAGYHALADAGHGTFIYAVLIDTAIEVTPVPGSDPEGNPDAESTIDTAAHETVEAMTNPQGDGWMDPNGFEVADKCETGPQTGPPLGYANDGAPYNQLINGHEYLIQEMWSNVAAGCEQSSTASSDGLPLPTVALRQFSPSVSGVTGTGAAGLAVRVGLIRGGGLVAEAAGVTRAGGAWGPITLRGPRGALHGAGDDRDEVIVEYGSGGPPPDLIAAGAGGNPYTEAGWTDWLDLDTGFSLVPNGLAISPCGQIGLVTVSINGRALPGSPVSECQTEYDATLVSLPHVTSASQVLLTSEDNRAVSIFAPNGALVQMTVPVGEPGSVSAVGNTKVPFVPGGVPTCDAQLRTGAVSCTGLVPRARYRLVRTRARAAAEVRFARANGEGAVSVAGFRGEPSLAGGDRISLWNAAGRLLTVLNVAHLRAAIDGDETVLAGGTCQPGDYYGAPLTSEPSSTEVGAPGAAGLGTVCPATGRAHGLPSSVIAQTDDLSGGVTRTNVPLLQGEAPAPDATLYGAFTAVAQAGVVGTHGGVVAVGASVSLTVRRAAGRGSSDGAVVVSDRDVARRGGVAVRALPPGVYDATWVVRDANDDTRMVKTTFVEAR